MPYGKQPVSRKEDYHRFIPYPTGHLITADTCIRCGRPAETPCHNARRRTRIRWKLLFGGGWKS